MRSRGTNSKLGVPQPLDKRRGNGSQRFRLNIHRLSVCSFYGKGNQRLWVVIVASMIAAAIIKGHIFAVDHTKITLSHP